jgi:hypothetical protein
VTLNKTHHYHHHILLQAAEKEKAMHAAEAARASSAGGGAFRALVDAEDSLGKELVKATAAHQHHKAVAKEDARAHAALVASAADTQEALAKAQVREMLAECL